MAEQIGYRLIGTIKSVKGTCVAGHKVGDKLEISGHSSGGLCGFFYHDILPVVTMLQFGGGTQGHPWGNAAGAAANRVALEASVKARNEGREIEKEARDILTEAAKSSPELAMAMETWKEIKFEFETVDKLDVA